MYYQVLFLGPFLCFHARRVHQDIALDYTVCLVETQRGKRLSIVELDSSMFWLYAMFNFYGINSDFLMCSHSQRSRARTHNNNDKNNSKCLRTTGISLVVRKICEKNP